MSRLLPALRDVRTPLALGYSMIAIGWAVAVVASDADPRNDPVGALYLEFSSRVSPIVEFGAITFVAALVGSGFVRLIDRFMQMTPSRRRGQHNPLDRPTPLAWGVVDDVGDDQEKAVLRSLFQRLHRFVDRHWEHADDFVTAFVRKKELRWAADEASFERERQQFLFHLRQDQEFDALQSEQLMRAVMIVPTVIAVILSVVWWTQDRATSTAMLTIALLLLAALLWADYRRIGSLLYDRWTSLAREYPTWLPLEYQMHRRADAHTIETSALKTLDAVHAAWREVVVADVARRAALRQGNDDESALVGALTGLGQQLSNLLVLPLGEDVEREVQAVDTSSAQFGNLVRGDEQRSLAARSETGQAIVELNRSVRRRLDELLERTASVIQPPPT